MPTHTRPAARPASPATDGPASEAIPTFARPGDAPPRAVITVSTGVLDAVARWTCANDVQRHLRLVVFRDGEMIATDGHRLVTVPCETRGYAFGVDRAHVLAATCAQRMLELGRLRELVLWPDGAGGVVFRLTSADPREQVIVTVPAHDVSDFPPIEQVMPAPAVGVSPQGYVMDPRYVAAIEEVTSAMHPEAHRGVRLVAWCAPSESGELLGPMLFTNAGGARFVIMPMRCP